MQLLRDRRFAPGAIIALGALIGLVVWLVTESGSSKKKAVAPVATSVADLQALAGKTGQPVYWLGRIPGRVFELTSQPNAVYLRYLPKGTAAGDSKPYLTIGTYPMQNAYDEMKNSATGGNTVVLDAPGGGIATLSKKKATNVYVAYPGSDVQVEVYSPSAAAARRFALSSRLRPLVETQPTPQVASKDAVSVSPRQLKSLSSSFKHPVYWAGPRAGVTYELTETSTGRTFVRYLPAGVKVGAAQAYFTVATYPMTGAFAATRRAGKGNGAITLKVPGGGVAVYVKGSATNIHLAYPGSNVQVEVYDPSPAVPRRLVTRGKIVPVK